MTLATKQSQIIRDLEQQIALGQFQPGQMLPTQKQLMRHYGVAMGTVQQAMGQLQSRGIIIARRGKGTIVSDPATLRQTGMARPQVEMIEIDIHEGEAPLLKNTAYAIQRQLNAHGFDLVMRAQLPKSADELAVWVQQIRAVVVVGNLPPKMVQALRVAGRPIIVLGELHHGACPPGIGQVTVAPQSVVDLAMACLHMLGHRRIMFVRGDWSYYFKIIGEAFHRSATKLGCAETCEELVAPTRQANSPTFVADELQRRPINQRPTAVLVDGGYFACRTIFGLQAAGMRVPDQISVFAINGNLPDQLPLPNLSRAETLTDQIGQRLADVLLESLRTGTVIRDHVPPSLYRGNTAQALAPI